VPDRGKLLTRRLLFAGDGRRSVFDKKPQRYAEDNRTEFICTSEVAKTTNKRLRSRYCTVEANYTVSETKGTDNTLDNFEKFKHIVVFFCKK